MGSGLCNGQTTVHVTVRAPGWKKPRETLALTGPSGGRSARGGIRTHDLLLRRQALYPAELRTQNSGTTRSRGYCA